MSNQTPQTQKAVAPVAAPTPKPTPAVAPKVRRGPATSKSPAELAAQRAATQAAQVKNLQLSVDRACGFINGKGGSVGKGLGLYRGLPLAVREAAVKDVEDRAATLRLLLGVETSQRTTSSLAAVLAESGEAKSAIAPKPTH